MSGCLNLLAHSATIRKLETVITRVFQAVFASAALDHLPLVIFTLRVSPSVNALALLAATTTAAPPSRGLCLAPDLLFPFLIRSLDFFS
jgi:hypothetical protein